MSKLSPNTLVRVAAAMTVARSTPSTEGVVNAQPLNDAQAWNDLKSKIGARQAKRALKAHRALQKLADNGDLERMRVATQHAADELANVSTAAHRVANAVRLFRSK